MALLAFTTAAADPNALIPVVATLLAGGGLGAVVAYRKAGPEMESVSVNTLRGVIEELRDELVRVYREKAEQDRMIGELRAEIGRCHERITQLEVNPPDHLG